MSVIDIAKALLRFKSISPDTTACLDWIADYLSQYGFECVIKTFASDESQYPVRNLYACNSRKEVSCFLGHSDVVPFGDEEATWSCDPLGESDGNKIYGRGVVDMKGAIACYLSAIGAYYRALTPQQSPKPIGVLITADEERDALNGTVKMLDFLHKSEYRFKSFLVGEPTSSKYIGDTIRIGRRGSINVHLTIKGVMGHVAYPALIKNPVYEGMRIVDQLRKYFDVSQSKDSEDTQTPTSIEVTSFNANSGACNMTPHKTKMSFNIRFCHEYTKEQLVDMLNYQLTDQYDYDIEYTCNALPFLTNNKALINKATGIIAAITSREVVCNTAGGTSDARFAHEYSDVVELGLKNEYAHKIDECCDIDDLYTLEKIYLQILREL